MAPHQEAVLGLLAEMGLQTFPQPAKGHSIFLHGDRRIRHLGSYPGMSEVAFADLRATVQRLEFHARQISLDRPLGATEASVWDRMTVADFLGEHVETDEAHAFLEITVRALFGAELDTLSLLFFLFYCRAGGGLMKLADTEAGAQSLRVRGGLGQLAERLHEVLGSRVLLGVPVDAVTQDAHGVTVAAGDSRWRARRVVCAVPPPLASRIAWTPGLPPGRVAAHTRMPMGSVIKFMASYPRTFWREQGLSGEALSTSGPVGLVYDNSSADALHPALVGFFVAQDARDASARSPGERRALALTHLETLFGPEARSVIDYVECDWLSEPYSQGCYSALMSPGVMTEVSTALRAPTGWVHWAGTETAGEGFGYVEGAVQSGQRVAREILAASEPAGHPWSAAGV